jgi:hypothetical protein
MKPFTPNPCGHVHESPEAHAIKEIFNNKRMYVHGSPSIIYALALAVVLSTGLSSESEINVKTGSGITL